MTAAPAPVRRDTARLIVLDPAGRVLLFRFTPPGRDPFWATPGGAVDPGEDFPAAARRELFEETGIIADPGTPVHIRMNRYHAFWGEEVIAEEQYFLIQAISAEIDISGHEPIEREVMTSHRWFARAELLGGDEVIYPEDIADLVRAAL
jgi:8-oxo-dGTP pyrophosphatase MutT (NUDIX family)